MSRPFEHADAPIAGKARKDSGGLVFNDGQRHLVIAVDIDDQIELGPRARASS